MGQVGFYFHLHGCWNPSLLSKRQSEWEKAVENQCGKLGEADGGKVELHLP